MLIPEALAQESGSAAGGSLFSLLPLVLVVVLFYFMLIRPQQKRSKQHREMVGALKSGDEVITIGGVLGTVEKVGDNYVTINCGEGKMHFQKQAVQTVLPKGTIESI